MRAFCSRNRIQNQNCHYSHPARWFCGLQRRTTGSSSCLQGLSGSFRCRRKNLGYLWAIQHGAEELYETDDDNEPVNNALPNLDNGYYVYNGTDRKVANPYAHFGFPHIWPRGYPLDQIRPQAQAERFSRLQARPLILQGLADKDPDVDAIFRCARHPSHACIERMTHRRNRPSRKALSSFLCSR